MNSTCQEELCQTIVTQVLVDRHRAAIAGVETDMNHYKEARLEISCLMILQAVIRIMMD